MRRRDRAYTSAFSRYRIKSLRTSVSNSQQSSCSAVDSIGRALKDKPCRLRIADRRGSGQARACASRAAGPCKRDAAWDRGESKMDGDMCLGGKLSFLRPYKRRLTNADGRRSNYAGVANVLSQRIASNRPVRYGRGVGVGDGCFETSVLSLLAELAG